MNCPPVHSVHLLQPEGPDKLPLHAATLPRAFLKLNHEEFLTTGVRHMSSRDPLSPRVLP